MKLLNYKYKKLIQISNPNTDAAYKTLADFQVKINVPYFPGMKPDFSDLYFETWNGIHCPHKVISYTTGINAEIYVKISVIGHHGTEIIMSYGSNFQDVQSSGKTFLFYQDFKEYADETPITSIPGWAWTPSSGAYSKVVLFNGEKVLKSHNAGNGYSTLSYEFNEASFPLIAEYKFYPEISETYTRLVTSKDSTSKYVVFRDDISKYLEYYSGSGYINLCLINRPGWNTVKMDAISGSEAHLTVNGAYYSSNVVRSNHDIVVPDKIKFDLYPTNTGDYYLGYYLRRKYAPISPAVKAIKTIPFSNAWVMSLDVITPVTLNANTIEATSSLQTSTVHGECKASASTCLASAEIKEAVATSSGLLSPAFVANAQGHAATILAQLALTAEPINGNAVIPEVVITNSDYTSFVIRISGVDVSSRVIRGPIIHKKDVFEGKLTPNECSFELDNSNNFWTVSNTDIEGQLVEIWINGTKQFTGYADRPRLNLNRRTLKISAKDRMKKWQKVKSQDKVFVNSALDTILSWLITNIAGLEAGEYNLETIGLTTGYAAYSTNDRLLNRLQEVVESVGGMMWFNEEGILRFKAGFKGAFTDDVVGTITKSKLEDLDLKWLKSEGDRVIVKSTNRMAKIKKEPIFTWSITADEENEEGVPPEGFPDGKDEDGNILTDEMWKAQFDYPAIDVDNYSSVNGAKEFDSGLALDETTYNSNFENGKLNYPDFMYLKILNSTGYYKSVEKLVINGRPIVENNLEMIYPADLGWETEKTIDNNLVSSKVWANSLAKWEYEKGNGKFEVIVSDLAFSEALKWKMGDKVNIVESSTGLSHRAWIRKLDIDYDRAKVTITLRSDRDSAFAYTPGGGTTGVGSNEPTVLEVGDGKAPDAPTDITATTNYANDECYVEVNWTASIAQDVLGYELRWSYDKTNWHTVIVTENQARFKVLPVNDIYYQVRAYDREGFRSDWAPAVPTYGGNGWIFSAEGNIVRAGPTDDYYEMNKDGFKRRKKDEEVVVEVFKSLVYYLPELSGANIQGYYRYSTDGGNVWSDWKLRITPFGGTSGSSGYFLDDEEPMFLPRTNLFMQWKFVITSNDSTIPKIYAFKNLVNAIDEDLINTHSDWTNGYESKSTNIVFEQDDATYVDGYSSKGYVKSCIKLAGTNQTGEYITNPIDLRTSESFTTKIVPTFWGGGTVNFDGTTETMEQIIKLNNALEPEEYQIITYFTFLQLASSGILFPEITKYKGAFKIKLYLSSAGLVPIHHDHTEEESQTGEWYILAETDSGKSLKKVEFEWWDLGGWSHYKGKLTHEYSIPGTYTVMVYQSGTEFKVDWGDGVIQVYSKLGGVYIKNIYEYYPDDSETPIKAGISWLQLQTDEKLT